MTASANEYCWFIHLLLVLTPRKWEEDHERKGKYLKGRVYQEKKRKCITTPRQATHLMTRDKKTRHASLMKKAIPNERNMQ